MSTSLMDILSCGLAAVIILMIIALSSSELQQEDLLRATFFEVRVHYQCDILDTLIVNSQKYGQVKGWLEPVKFDSILSHIDSLPAYLDSIIDIRLYRGKSYAEIVNNEIISHACQEIVISITPDPNIPGFQLEFQLDNSTILYREDSTYTIEYKVVNDFNNLPKKFTNIGTYSGRNSFLLDYSKSPGILVK